METDHETKSEAMTATSKDAAVKELCTAKQKVSERCLNSICLNEVEPNARGDRLYCSHGCRQQASLIRRVAKLFELTETTMVEILRKR